MPDYIKPTTATDISGQEVIRHSSSQGDVIVVDGTPQVLLGFQRGGFGTLDYGFKVSQQGIDVLTADATQLIMSSAFNSFKILKTGTQNVTRTGGNDSGSVDVSTSITSAPSFLCFVWNPSASPKFTFQTPFISFNTSGADSGKIIGQKRALYDPSTGVVRLFVDATSIYGAYGSSETWTFRYYLLAETVQ